MVEHFVDSRHDILSVNNHRNIAPVPQSNMEHSAVLSEVDFLTWITDKETRNCPEKAMKISHSNPNQSAPSIYIMIELCYFSLDQ